MSENLYIILCSVLESKKVEIIKKDFNKLKNKNLFEIGIDSIDYISLLIKLEEKLEDMDYLNNDMISLEVIERALCEKK